MTDISDDQVDELLRQAEQRLKNDAASAVAVPTTAVAGVKASASKAVEPQRSSNSDSSSKDLSVRAPPQPRTGQKAQAKVRARLVSPFVLHTTSSPFRMMRTSPHGILDMGQASVLDHRTMAS
jgi:hypothetical protein